MTEEQWKLLNAKLDFIADISIIAACNAEGIDAMMHYKRIKRNYNKIEEEFNV